jgi:exo-beta-1,3-glucanase (GH17 family)
MAIGSSSRVYGVALALSSLWLIAGSGCANVPRSVDAAGAGAGGLGSSAGSGGGGGLPNAAFLARAIPDAQHLDVTETCPDGVRPAGAAGDAGVADAAGKRCIPDRVLARPAVCYSGYRAKETPNALLYPTEAEVKQDLDLLVRAGYSFLRLFDASPHAETVLKVISDNAYDIKLQLGIWIAGPKDKQDAANQLQIQKGIALANQYPNLIVGVSVGNETLDSWSSVLTPAADLVGYIEQVRAAIVQPVTTDDMYPPFELSGGYQDVLAVLQSVDYLSVHDYAAIDANFGNWDYERVSVAEGPDRAQAMMKASVDYTKTNIATVRNVLKEVNLDLPIIIGEAGWKSRMTDPLHVAEPAFSHEVNQQMFFAGLESWVYGDGRDADSPTGVFYFEAFDEPWKTSDDGWGLFDTNRNAKYVMWSQFPELTPPGATPYTSADAIYFKP